jgi:hypothetical protein
MFISHLLCRRVWIVNDSGDIFKKELVYMCKSDPQIAEVVTLINASSGCSSLGRGRSSMDTLKGSVVQISPSSLHSFILSLSSETQYWDQNQIRSTYPDTQQLSLSEFETSCLVFRVSCFL